MERQNVKSGAGGRSELTGTSSPDYTLAVRAPNKNYYLKFPKEFERSLADYFDKRYLIILICTFIFQCSVILYYLANPPKEEFTAKDIARIQRQFASLILEKEPVQVEEPQVAEGIGAGQSAADAEKAAADQEEKEEGDRSAEKEKKRRGSSTETKTTSAEARSADRSSAADSRRKSREQISREVASKGLLGVLTAGGPATSGAGVVDVLGGDNIVISNIGDVLGEIGGLKTTGSAVQGSGSAGNGAGGGKGVRGGRASSAGSIDDLISDLGPVSSKKVKRRSRIMVTEEAAIETAPGAQSSGRDRDQIMAIVNSHNSAIQSCYQRALKRNPSLRGKIVVRFTINYLGKVSKVDVVSSTLSNASVERCIVSRIRRWDDFGVIDKSKGSATIRQVYTFGY